MAEDRNRPSSSEELLRRATESITGGPDAGYDATFTPTSPADSFAPPTDRRRADGDPAPDDADAMSAAEIAHALAERPTPTTAHREEPSADVEPATSMATVTDRIRALSSRGDVRGDTAQPEPPTPVPEWNGDRWSTPSPEWQARESATKATTRRSFPVPAIRTLISLAVFGFVGFGLLVSALDGKAPVSDIAVGECFVVGDALEVDELPVVDCSEEHDAELFARVTISGFGSDYPGDDPVFDWLYEQCLDLFPGYVGEPYEESEFWIDMFIPTVDGWDDGDRTGLCTAVMVDDDLDIRSHTRTAQSSGTSA
jgi:hypothetical protein